MDTVLKAYNIAMTSGGMNQQFSVETSHCKQINMFPSQKFRQLLSANKLMRIGIVNSEFIYETIFTIFFSLFSYLFFSPSIHQLALKISLYIFHSREK